MALAVTRHEESVVETSYNHVVKFDSFVVNILLQIQC